MVVLLRALVSRKLAAAAAAAALMALGVGIVATTTDQGGHTPAGKVTNLPRRVLAGYWQGWGNPMLRLGDVPEQFNLIMASFAVGDPTGRVTFSQSVQSPASFVADVDAHNSAGRRVVLSVGGAKDGGLEITTQAQETAFLDSVTEIIDAYHFQGIDWDLEHGLEPARVADATRKLKARYGPGFLVTMAPMLGANEQQQLELAARIKDVLDMAHPQFYNGGQPTPAFIVGHALAWAQVVGQEKIGMGFMTVQTPSDTGIQTPAAVCATWGSLVKQAPKARGVATWSINLDMTSGYAFALTCGPKVLAAR